MAARDQARRLPRHRAQAGRPRLYSRPGNDLTRHFPLIVDVLARLELLREPNHHQRKSDQKEEETPARTVVSLVPHFPLALC
jgi:hypothetical protein